ncbi:unnamed protein product [Umbelopsis sp. WA50703]
MSDLREKSMIPILTKHEQALAKNGTGFYVGDKMSLADVVAAVSLPRFDYNNELTKETHPHLFALYENLSTYKAFQTLETRFRKTVNREHLFISMPFSPFVVNFCFSAIS